MPIDFCHQSEIILQHIKGGDTVMTEAEVKFLLYLGRIYNISDLQ
jgi:hypothetical protein